MSRIFDFSYYESVVEEAALGWLEGMGYPVLHGPHIAPEGLQAEREDYGQVVVEGRLRQVVVAEHSDLRQAGGRLLISGLMAVAGRYDRLMSGPT